MNETKSQQSEAWQTPLPVMKRIQNNINNSARRAKIGYVTVTFT